MLHFNNSYDPNVYEPSTDQGEKAFDFCKKIQRNPTKEPNPVLTEEEKIAFCEAAEVWKNECLARGDFNHQYCKFIYNRLIEAAK